MSPTTPPTLPTAAEVALPAPALTRAPSALHLTLDPVGHEEFLEEYADRRALVVERGEPGRFDAVLSDADVERLVCETATLPEGVWEIQVDGMDMSNLNFFFLNFKIER